MSAAAHASSVRTVRSLKRKLSNSLSPQSGPATADAGLRAQLSETREEKAKVEEENERLRGALKAKQRQLTQSRHYRKDIAARVRSAEHDAADLRAELAERATDVEEELMTVMCAYEQYEIEAIVDEADNSRRTATSPTPLVLQHDGRYDDALRAVIYAHIRAGVGKDRIAQLVAVTMELLANRRIDKLPSAATIARMATELNTLTHVQLYDRLTTDPTASRRRANEHCAQRVRTRPPPKPSSQNGANATMSCAAHVHARCKPPTNANTRNAPSKPNATQHWHCGRAKRN